MKLSQLVILVSAIVIIIIFYNLPRVVVNDDPDESISQENTNKGKADDTSQAKASLHSSSFDQKSRANAKKLRKKYLQASIKEKKIKFADSLAALFSENAMYDSAAKYHASVCALDSAKENIRKAGNSYFQAFNYATNADLSKKYGRKAQSYFDEILKKEPDNTDIQAKKAMTVVATDHPMKGVRMLTGILEKESDHKLSLLYLGMLSIQSGQYQKAEERLSRLLEKYPDNLKARLYLGMAYNNMGKTKKARKQFIIVKNNSNNPFLKSNAEGYLKNL